MSLASVAFVSFALPSRCCCRRVRLALRAHFGATHCPLALRLILLGASSSSSSSPPPPSSCCCCCCCCAGTEQSGRSTSNTTPFCSRRHLLRPFGRSQLLPSKVLSPVPFMRSACFSWDLPVRRRIWNELLCNLTTYGCGLRWCTTFFCCCINFTDTTASPLQLSLKSPSSSRVFHRRSACAAVCNVLPWTLARTLCARLLHLHVTSCFVPVDHDRQRPCQTWSDLGRAQRGLSLIFLLFLFHVRAPYPSSLIQSPRGCCNTGGVCCTSTCTRVRTHGSRTHGSRS